MEYPHVVPVFFQAGISKGHGKVTYVEDQFFCVKPLEPNTSTHVELKVVLPEQTIHLWDGDVPFGEDTTQAKVWSSLGALRAWGPKAGLDPEHNIYTGYWMIKSDKPVWTQLTDGLKGVLE